MESEKSAEVQPTTDTTKKILIFDITFSLISTDGTLQTQILERKLTNLFKEKKKDITIEIYNSDQVEQKAKSATIILLTPTFAYAQEEIQKKFQNIPVIAITKEEYGTIDVHSLWGKMEEYL